MQTVEQTVNESIEGFANLIGSAARKVDCPPDGLAAVLDRVAASAPDNSRRVDAQKAAVRLFIRARMSQRFPLLDKSVFELRRFLKIEFRGGQGVLAADSRTRPRVLRESGKGVEARWAETTLIQGVQTGRGVFRDTRPEVQLANVAVPGSGGRSSVRVSARFPSDVGTAQKRRGHEAQAAAFDAFAEAFRVPAAAELLTEDWSMKFDPSFTAYWIPAAHTLTVEQVDLPRPTGRDPAYVMHLAGDRYLLSLWEAEGEEPLEAILREFSTGPWAGIVASPEH